MNAKLFKNLIKEAVREAVREEIGVLLLEQKKQELNLYLMQKNVAMTKLC